MSDEEIEAAAGTWVYGQGVVDDEFMQAMLTAGFKAGARWAVRVPVPGESEAREAESIVREPCGFHEWAWPILAHAIEAL